jgi:hypothetical protein
MLFRGLGFASTAGHPPRARILPIVKLSNDLMQKQQQLVLRNGLKYDDLRPNRTSRHQTTGVNWHLLKCAAALRSTVGVV